MAECTDPKLGSLLHGYEMGGLSESELATFESHMLECEVCFAEENALKEAAELMRGHKEVKEYIATLAEEDSKSESKAHAPIKRSWLDSFSFGWLKPIPMAILLLIVGVSMYRLGSDVIPPEDTRQTLNLYPMRGGQEHMLVLGQSDEATINFTYHGAEPGKIYQVSITSASEEVVFSNDGFAEFNDSDRGSLTMPMSRFEEGLYHLTIVDPSGSPPDNIQEYYFRVRYSHTR